MATACFMFTISALSSFAVTYWAMKCVFFLALLVPRLVSQGWKQEELLHLVPVVSVCSAVRSPQLSVVILRYCLAIGQGFFSHKLSLSNADSFFLSRISFGKVVLWKNKMRLVERASAWSPAEGTTTQLVTHGCEEGWW